MDGSERLRAGAKGPGLSASGRLFVDAERQQHVARPSAERAVAGVDVDHSAGDDRAGTADRRAFRRHAVHRLEVAVGVVLPEQRSVLRRVGAHAAIVRPGEHRTWNDGNRGENRGVAAASRRAFGRRRRCVPGTLTGRQVDGVKTARLRTVAVGDGEIRLRRIDRRSELHPAQRAPLRRAVLPQHGAARVRIERPADARLLSVDDDVLAVRPLRENRRTAEIEIGPTSAGQFAGFG